MSGLSILAAMLVLAEPPLPPHCDRELSAEVVAAAWTGSDTAWVAGTFACGMCKTTGLLARVDFAKGTGVAALLPAVEDPRDELRFVAAAGNTVAAAGFAYCELPHAPFLVFSTDGGERFTRVSLERRGNHYSAEIVGLEVTARRILVGVDFTLDSNDERQRRTCFEVRTGEVVARPTRCGTLRAAKPPGVTVQPTTASGSLFRVMDGGKRVVDIVRR